MYKDSVVVVEEEPKKESSLNLRRNLGRNNEKRGEGEAKKSIISLASHQFSSFSQFNIFLTLAGSVEAFINARIIKRFARVATRENTKFKTQKA